MAQPRVKGIIIASIVGIIANLLLTAFKMVVGFLANSIAIILDGVNNASDALSSIITIVGTKLAGMRPSHNHPFGYGRIEYITSMVIAVIILAAGVVSARESIVKIISPAENDYTWITVTVVVVAIFVKIFIGIYLKRAGKRYDSQALVASAVDSNYDAVISFGTLVAALVSMFWNINIDGIVGLIISVFVLKAGIDILKDALDPIIGERENDNFGRQIKEYVSSFDGVIGATDLVLDNFGPQDIIGVIRIGVNDTMPASRIYEISRGIERGVKKKFGVSMMVGIYTVNDSPEYAPMHAHLQDLAAKHPEVLEVHGFYVEERTHTVNFDIVIDFKSDTESVRNSIIDEMKKKYPNYTFNVVTDQDF